jgi:hypothetical protein
MSRLSPYFPLKVLEEYESEKIHPSKNDPIEPASD